MTLPQVTFSLTVSYCLFLLSPLSLQSSWELSLMLNHSLQCLQSYMKRSKLTRKWLFSSPIILYCIFLLLFLKKIFFSLPELFDWQFAFFFHTTQGVCVSLLCVWSIFPTVWKICFLINLFFELWYKLFSFMMEFYAYLICYNITK